MAENDDLWEVALETHKRQDLDAFIEKNSFGMTSCDPIRIEEFERLLHLPLPFFVLVGRPSCPYCRDIAKHLDLCFSKSPRASIEMIHTPLYLYDTKRQGNIPEFLKTRGFTTVPILLFYSTPEFYARDVRGVTSFASCPAIGEDWYVHENADTRSELPRETEWLIQHLNKKSNPFFSD